VNTESKTEKVDEYLEDWIEHLPELLDPNSKLVLLSVILSIKKRKRKTVKTLDVLKEYLEIVRKIGWKDFEKDARVNVEYGLKRLRELRILRVTSYTEWRYKPEYDIEVLSSVLKKDSLLSPFL